jgi:hypothetical protein
MSSPLITNVHALRNSLTIPIDIREYESHNRRSKTLSLQPELKYPKYFGYDPKSGGISELFGREEVRRHVCRREEVK